MIVIKSIIANEILNSRGYPSIFARLILSDNREVSIAIPGYEENFNYQNKQLFDKEDNRFSGKGVKKAVYIINNLIAPKLRNVSALKQIEIDNWLNKADRTNNKEKLGVNTISTISYLIAKAGSLLSNSSLYQYINKLYNDNYQTKIKIEKIPIPIFTLLKGGKHGQVNLDFYEFQIIPSSQLNYIQAYDLGVHTYHNLRHQYKFMFTQNLDVFEAINEIFLQMGKKLGIDAFISINFRAEDYHKNNQYLLKDKLDPVNYDNYFKFIEDILKKYSPLNITDIFSNKDIDNWKKICSLYSKEIYISIDNLFSGKKEKADFIIKNKIANTLILKPVQIGALTDLLSYVDFIKKNEINYIFASELEETNDTFIADLSVGLQSEFVSFSLPVHGENVAKYNRLLEIFNIIIHNT